MRVKSINYTGFSRKNKTKFFKLFFLKKKLFTLVNSATVEPCSTVMLFPLRKCSFSKTCGPAEILVGPTIRKQFFLLNQTTFGVAAGEPHPQPRYQTATLYLYLFEEKNGVIF